MHPLPPLARLARAAIATLAAVGLAAFGLAACGPTCGEVAADHRRALAAWPGDALDSTDDQPGPHVLLSLPVATVEGLLEAAFHAAVGPLALPELPGVGPLAVGLGDATVTMSALRLAPGPMGASLALAATLNLGDARPRSAQGDPENRRAEDELRFTLRAVVDLVPVAMPEGVGLRFDPAQVRDVALAISPSAARGLAAWLHDRLPEAAQARLSPAWLSLLLPALVEGLSGAAWVGVRSLLEGNLQGPTLLWPLPAGVPTPSAIHVAVVGDRLRLALSVPGGGPALVLPPAGWDAFQGEAALVGLSGPTLAAVAGAAIVAGAAPGRFKADGVAHPEGSIRLLPAWGTGDRPARLRVWRWPDQCIGATLAGVPSADVTEGQLRFALSDVSTAAVWGSPLSLLAAWWSSAMTGARGVQLQGAGAVQVRGVPLGWDIRWAQFDARGLWLSGRIFLGSPGGASGGEAAAPERMVADDVGESPVKSEASWRR